MVQKRPAANSRAVEAAKKPKIVDPVTRKLDTVAAGILDAGSDDVPPIVAQMLTDMLATSLATYSDVRHSMQHGVVDMIDKVLSGHSTSIQKQIVDVKEQLGGADHDKAQRETAVTEAAATVNTTGAALLEQKQKLADDATVFKEAKGAVSVALADQKETDEDLLLTQSSKDKLEEVVSELVKPLIENGGEDQKSKSDQLIATLRKFEFDNSLIISIPQALLKVPAARGPFDTMVATNLNEEVQKRIQTLISKLSEVDSVKAEKVIKVEAAESTFADAREKQLASATAFKAAQEDHRKAESVLKSAQRRLNSHGPEMQKVAKHLDVLNNSLDTFRNGALAAFNELKDRATPQPSPEPESREEEAGVEDAGEATSDKVPSLEAAQESPSE